MRLDTRLKKLEGDRPREQVAETAIYVADLRAAEEERAVDRLDSVVASWRAALPHSPRRAFYQAQWLRALVAEPAPEGYDAYRPGLDGSFSLAERPALVVVAKRHDGAAEAAAWADDFQREHAGEAAYILSRTDRHPKP